MHLVCTLLKICKIVHTSVFFGHGHSGPIWYWYANFSSLAIAMQRGKHFFTPEEYRNLRDYFLKSALQLARSCAAMDKKLHCMKVALSYCLPVDFRPPRDQRSRAKPFRSFQNVVSLLQHSPGFPPFKVWQLKENGREEKKLREREREQHRPCSHVGHYLVSSPGIVARR